MKIKRGYGVVILLAAALLALSAVPFVSALGVTPGRTTFSFEPGAEKEFSFSVINSAEEEVNVMLVIQGELNESIVVSESEFAVGSGGEKKVNVSFVMPSSLEPGAHKATIVAMASAGEADAGGTYLGAVVGVATEVVVLVPYPGKYVDIGMNVVGPDSDGEIQFVFPAINRGLEDIEKASVVVEIFDADERKIATVGTGEFPIESGERIELAANWNAEGVSFGKYRFSAVLFYDDELKAFGNYFTIGEPVIEIKEIKVNDFRLGGIAKFEIKLKNMWNEEVSGVYADLVVYDNRSRIIADFRSASDVVPAGGEKTLVSYWDTSGVNEATYDSAIAIVYNQKTNEKKFQLEVKQDRINVIGVSYVISDRAVEERGSLLVPVLITAIAVLAIINLLWFLWIRRRMIRRRH